MVIRTALAIISVTFGMLAMAPSTSAAPEPVTPYAAIAQVDLNFWDEIPLGIFNNSRQLGKISVGDTVTVIGKENVTRIGRVDQWLKVSVCDADIMPCKEGWVYNGTTEAPVNFKAKE